MELSKMYRGIEFSPTVMLTANISATDTVIPVSDVSAFPDAPNIATIGTDIGAETIIYANISEGALTGCTRGIEGTAKEWSADEIISRNFTAKDHNDIIKNIEELYKNKLDAEYKVEVVNSSDISKTGKALDATQNNPNVEGTLAKKIAENANKINNLNDEPFQGVITGAKSNITIARSLLIKRNGWVEIEATFTKTDGSNFTANASIYVTQASYDNTKYSPLAPSIALAAHCTGDINGMPAAPCAAMLWTSNQGIIVAPSVGCPVIRVSGVWYAGGGTI